MCIKTPDTLTAADQNPTTQIMENEACDILKKTLFNKNTPYQTPPCIFIAEMPLKDPSKLSKAILLLASAQMTQKSCTRMGPPPTTDDHDPLSVAYISYQPKTIRI